MKVSSESVPAPPFDADVARVDFGGCLLLRGDGSHVRARVRGRLMGPRKALGNAVVVGDRVVAERAPGSAEDDVLVLEVHPRRNAFSRRAPGREGGEQVVAANLDQVVLVASMRDPEFRPGLADRVLCQAARAEIPTRLVLDKIDLAEPPAAAEIDAVLRDYARAGVPGHAVSGRTGAGLDALREACRGRRSLFVGHSGVGKSTLLNALVPGLELLAGQVNPKTGKGRHTTTAAWMLRPAPDLELVDTPGIRAFALWGIEPADLDRAYLEFRPHLGRCRFADCSHSAEPGCAVRAAVEEGTISELRYRSFLKLREELRRERTNLAMRQGGWI